jgi:YlmC/YmxH family sporulation protein
MNSINICTSDLKMKEVVNILDGKRLGAISDIELDIETGKLTAIVVPGPGRFLGLFGRNEDIVIPWDKINKIGVDCILVDCPAFAELKHSEK